MKKKALCLASMASNLDNFNRNNVKILQELGYRVTLATNTHSTEDTNSQDKIDSFMADMENEGVSIVHIDFSRSIGNIKKQISSYRQVRDLLKEGFDLIHCHSPICSVITRFCAKKYRKEGLKVIYTAHGFHFYKGAPLKNWLLFYPIEKMCSRWTDVLITINKEDYELAKRKMHAKKVEYVPGVGVDIKKFSNVVVDRDKKREELGIPKDAKMLLSVGELNENKNHKIVIEALGKLHDPNFHYVIAGVGDQKEKLESLAKENNVNLHLLGYRKDISELCKCADLYVHPSLREGLPVALMEAIASKTTVICSRIRGNEELVTEDNMFSSINSDELKDRLDAFIAEKLKKTIAHNYKTLKQFDLERVNQDIADLYAGGVLKGIDIY